MDDYPSEGLFQKRDFLLFFGIFLNCDWFGGSSDRSQSTRLQGQGFRQTNH
jgi:hypothetical protein